MESIKDSDLNVFKSTRGAIKLEILGFVYEKNKTYKDKYYWLCEMKRNKQYFCNTRVITVYNEEKNLHSLVNKNIPEHNHEPDVFKSKVAGVVNSIKEQAGTNFIKKPSQIIIDTISTTSQDIAAHTPSHHNLKQIIYRYRKSNSKITNEPTQFDFELDLSMFQIENMDTSDLIIKDKIKNGKRIIFFTTKKLLNYMEKSRFYLMDGTFKIAPKIFTQLYAIHGSTHQNKTFPMVIALLTNKSTRCYNMFFEMLLEFCESLGINLCPRYCIMDYEKASQKSFCKYFEDVAIKGCNFHLGQIIYRRIQERGFQTLYGTNVQFAMEMKSLFALAYLSAEDIPTYFDEWRNSISPEAEIIAEWFSDNYIWGTSSSPPKYSPKQWSTEELIKQNIPRTQNNAEAWHHRINSIAGADHIGFYKLSIQMIKELIFSFMEIEKLSIGVPPPAKKKKVLDKMHRLEVILSNRNDYTKIGLLKALGANLKLA